MTDTEPDLNKVYLVSLLLILFTGAGASFGTAYYYEEVKVQEIESESGETIENLRQSNERLRSSLDETRRVINATSERMSEKDRVESRMEQVEEELSNLDEDYIKLRQAYRFTYTSCEKAEGCTPPSEHPDSFEREINNVDE
jgi:predicted nuclease with TOPRIM domain